MARQIAVWHPGESARPDPVVMVLPLSPQKGETTEPSIGEARSRQGSALSPVPPPWRLPRERSAAMMLGLLIGEVFGLENSPSARLEHEHSSPNKQGMGLFLPFSELSFPDPRARARMTGPRTQEAFILAELGLCGRISTRRLVEELAEHITDKTHPLYQSLKHAQHLESARALATDLPDVCCAPRALPLAVLAGANRAELTLEIFATCFATHRDIRSISGTAALTWAAREAMTLGESTAWKASEVLETIGSYARSVERILIRRHSEFLSPVAASHAHALSSAIFSAAQLVGASFEDIERQLIAFAREDSIHDDNLPLAEKATLIVPLTLLLTFSGSPDFARNLLVAAHSVAYRPTLCALVGALSGARLGTTTIPESFLVSVSEADRATSLGRALAGDPFAARKAKAATP